MRDLNVVNECSVLLIQECSQIAELKHVDCQAKYLFDKTLMSPFFNACF